MSESSDGAEPTEHLCGRCARHMKTCCQTLEIYVTRRDVERIGKHTGRSEFTTFKAPSDPAYLDQDDDPQWLQHVFDSDGKRRVLARHANGDCTFLGEKGCVLPTEVRPLVCRIYPYDYNAEGLKSELTKGCPLELLRPGLGLLDELAMTDDTPVLRWHAQLYEEIKLEKKEDARRSYV